MERNDVMILIFLNLQCISIDAAKKPSRSELIFDLYQKMKFPGKFYVMDLQLYSKVSSLHICTIPSEINLSLFALCYRERGFLIIHLPRVPLRSTRGYNTGHP